MDTFRLKILASDRPFYEGDCISLVVPTLRGQQGILAHHSNFISAVVPGWVEFRFFDGKEEKKFSCAVSEGIIKTEDNEVLILVATAEYPEEIDENRARRAADAAREELLQKQSVQEYYAAKARLARAVNRLKVKKHRTDEM